MPLGLCRSVLLAAHEEPEEGKQRVVVADLDGELSLALGIGAEDPGRVEALAVDRVDLLRLVEQVVEVIDDRLVRDDGDLPVVEVVPHDHLEPLGGVLEVEDGQLHGLGAVGADDPDGVPNELDEVIGATTDTTLDKREAQGVEDEATLVVVTVLPEQFVRRRVSGPPIGELDGHVEAIES